VVTFEGVGVADINPWAIARSAGPRDRIAIKAD
jgi:hypothetical protein